MNARRWWKWGVAAVILAGLGWQLARIDATGLIALPAPAWTVLLLATALALASYAAFIQAWVVLRGRGETWPAVAPAWWASLLARYLPGGIGQGALRLGAAHAAGEGLRNTLERYVAEQLLACFSATVVALALVIAWPVPLPAGLLGALAVVAILAAAAPLVGKHAGLDVGWNPRALAWMLAGHVAMASGFAAFTQSMVADADAATLASAATAFLIAGVAGLLAIFVPAGLGVRETVLAVLLAPRIGAAQAITLALAARLWLIACEIVGWALVTTLVRRTRDG
jgi:hypothetical protein